MPLVNGKVVDTILVVERWGIHYVPIRLATISACFMKERGCSMDWGNIDSLADFITEETMITHLKEGFLVWGIEGTEEKIKELYSNSPVILEKYLGVYHKLVSGGYHGTT